MKCTAASNANGKSGGDGVLSQNISTLESEESDNKASNPADKLTVVNVGIGTSNSKGSGDLERTDGKLVGCSPTANLVVERV